MGYRVHGWPMFTIFCGASLGEGEGNEAGGAPKARSRRGTSRAALAAEEKEESFVRMRQEDREFEVQS